MSSIISVAIVNSVFADIAFKAFFTFANKSVDFVSTDAVAPARLRMTVVGDDFAIISFVA